MDAYTAGTAFCAGGGGTVNAGPLPETAALALEAQSGNVRAAERLFTKVRPRLVTVGLALGVPGQDVSDLVQDTLLAAHRALASFDPALGSFEAWIGAILVRRARNGLRALRRRRQFLAVLRRVGIPRPRRTSEPIEGVEARLTLERRLNALTSSQREVVAFYEIGELTAEDAGRLLGISPAGVRSIARDARLRLAEAARREPMEREVRR